jgi:hypothetical protein
LHAVTINISVLEVNRRSRQLTSCQGIRDAFAQRGSSSTEDKDTHIMSRDQGGILSARLKLEHKNKTLTHCKGTRDAFSQRGLSSTEDQDTHILSKDQRCVQSAMLELDGVSRLAFCKGIRDVIG